METGGKWEREAERATEESAESHGDEREQTGTHEGDPAAGLDEEQQEGSAAAGGPGAVSGAGSGDSNLADDEDPRTTGTDPPDAA
jgi:hypothetical protein